MRLRPRNESLLLNRRPRFGREKLSPNRRYHRFCFWHDVERRYEYAGIILMGRIEQIKLEAGAAPSADDVRRMWRTEARGRTQGGRR